MDIFNYLLCIKDFNFFETYFFNSYSEMINFLQSFDYVSYIIYDLRLKEVGIL